MKYVIAVGDMKVGKKGDLIITHALGSCLGLMVYDPVAKIGGLLHAMLPISKINMEKARGNPCMFVDTGVPLLFKSLYEMGGQKKRMIIKAAGCGNPMGNNEMFKIGHRNSSVLKKLLSKNSLMIESESIGGTNSRSVNFNISTGSIIIRSAGTEIEL